MKIIDEKTEKYVRENFNDLDFFFYEEYDDEVELKHTEDGVVLVSGKEQYMEDLKENSIIELISLMPLNHTFKIHIQIPEVHENEYYPLCDDIENRYIVFEEYDDNNRYVYPPSYLIDDFKQSVDIVNYDSFYSIIKNLDYSSTRYIGIELINRKTNEYKYVISHNFKIIQDIISANNVDDNLLQLFKENILDIFEQNYPSFKERCQNIKDYYNIVSEYMIDIVYNNKEHDMKNEWLETLKSYKADTEHKNLNCWRSFIKADIDFKSLKNLADIFERNK
ncbi:hypothetical protein J6W34_03580 [bacterium]|nr:hypothetical protein [bacterium]